jgi:hypothetical protein
MRSAAGQHSESHSAHDRPKPPAVRLAGESVVNADFCMNRHWFAVQEVWFVAPFLHGLDGGRNQFGRPRGGCEILDPPFF